MTASDQKLQAAYNEFIAEYCERGEKCRATRDEAHEEADKWVSFGKSLARIAKVAGLSVININDMVEAVSFDEPSAEPVVAWAVAMEMGS